MLSLMIQAINGGKHVHDENVEYLKTKKLTIEMLGEKCPTIPHQSRWGIRRRYSS